MDLPPADGCPLAPVQGKSWKATLAGEAESPRGPDDWLGWELWGNRAIRKGDWKLLWLHKPMGIADWELFNLREDPGETQDLASQHPEKVRELLALWDEYVKTNNVIMPDRHMFESLEDALPVRVPVSEGSIGRTDDQYQRLETNNPSSKPLPATLRIDKSIVPTFQLINKFVGYLIHRKARPSRTSRITPS